MNPPVKTSRDGAVTVVTLDRPDVRNAVDADTARQLHEAFVAFEADPDARVAVFHGAHGHFCAGWDLQAGAALAAAGNAPVLGELDFSPQDVQPWGRWARRACCCPSRSLQLSAARRWLVAWNWPCGATCG
jgi:enoyl-CoA hydratase